jgi:hypothetical protein
MSLQSELEDLCFAVLQPSEFRRLRDAVFEYCGLPPMTAEVRCACCDRAAMVLCLFRPCCACCLLPALCILPPMVGHVGCICYALALCLMQPCYARYA